MDAKTICDTCGAELSLGEWPWCPHGSMGKFSVVPDDYGRDIVNENMGHQPVTYRTRSERKRLMKQHGVEEFVRHVGTPGEGSDKSNKTSRWI